MICHLFCSMCKFVISISFSFIQDESDEPELDGVAVGLLTVISDHDTSPVCYHPVRISVVIESDAVVSLPRLGNAFLHCHFFTGNCCSYIDFKIDFTQKRDLPLTMNKTKSA